MAQESSLYFYPKRVLWLGGIGLFVGLFLFFSLFLRRSERIPFSFREKKENVELRVPLSFSLGWSDVAPVLPVPDLRGEILCSWDPPRPDGGAARELERLLVRLKRSGQIKRVSLPCRLDLQYQGETLVFAPSSSPFFIELARNKEGQIEGKGEAGTFSLSVQECPVQAPFELREDSPFRLLAEARWWGRDQFQESGERLEIGSEELLDVKEGEWLVWKEQKWRKSQAPEKSVPIARIQSVGKTLILEGWDTDGFLRLGLNSAVGPLFKVKGDELLTSIRVRSEKRVSCMLEKQCLILKTGDWVFKSNGRWKVLRKKEEREAFSQGKLLGELFVLDQIVQKQGQKVIQGRLFNLGRTQMASIEAVAQSSRRAKGTSRKGKVS